MGDGMFLCNDAGAWFTYDSRSNVLNPSRWGPASTHGGNVYSALADTKLYFSQGGGTRTGGPLWKYVVGVGICYCDIASAVHSGALSALGIVPADVCV